MTGENGIAGDNTSKEKKEDEPAQQFLTFSICGEEYGVELMSVREIKGWSKTTRLPNSPEFMKGVINLRGVVIPIFDLRNRFGMGETEPTEKNAVIILAVEKRLIGILVDAVSDILNTTIDQIRPAPHVESKIDASFVSGLIAIEDKMVVLLDVEKIFDMDTIVQAEKESAKIKESGEVNN
jgi:purine-binding chemotaxis protein CheW